MPTRIVTIVLSASLLLLAHGSAPGSLRADDASEARLHWELGGELYARGRYQQALDHFLAANRLAPNHGITLAIARTYRFLADSRGRGRRERASARRHAFNWFETLMTEFTAELDDEARAEAERGLSDLASQLSILHVLSDPAGAQLFIGREDLGSVGSAPRRLAVAPGDTLVLARLDAHRIARAEVSATRGAVVQVDLTLEPIVGHLLVTSDPPGAAIRLEAGRALGVTPFEGVLPIGPHTISITHDGHVTQTHAVTIREEEEATLDLHLQRAASDMAVLTVRGSEGAVVYVGDERVGTVPLTRDDFHPGVNSIEVRRDGMQTYHVDTVFEAGGATRLEVELRPPPAWAWDGLRWLAWGSAAALGIVGGVMGGLALTEGDAFYADPTSQHYEQTHTLAAASDALLGGALIVGVVTVVLELALEPPEGSTGIVHIDR